MALVPKVTEASAIVAMGAVRRRPSVILPHANVPA
jgi:hypothetical protein